VVGERHAQRTAESVVSTLRGQLLRQILSLGPRWLAGERPGELSLTATRGLHSLHNVLRPLPSPPPRWPPWFLVVLLAWIATQDWLSFAVVVLLVMAVPVTMIYFGREANRRTARQWRRLGSLAGRFLQLVEGLPTCVPSGVTGTDAARSSSQAKACASPPCARCAWPSCPPCPWT